MWNPSGKQLIDWLGAVARREEKMVVAKLIAARVQQDEVVGAGSGSTALLALEAIAARVKDEGLRCRVVPTSRETEILAGALGVPTASLAVARPAWSYDGADEVDAQGNLIKGRGGAMFREKLVMRAAGRACILVDHSKFVQRLGEKFPVPVEVHPDALAPAQNALLDIEGARDCTLRTGTGKDGPIITENGNFILDVHFDAIGPETELAIKAITGVLESGLFWGFKPEILTG